MVSVYPSAREPQRTSWGVGLTRLTLDVQPPSQCKRSSSKTHTKMDTTDTCLYSLLGWGSSPVLPPTRGGSNYTLSQNPNSLRYFVHPASEQ